LKLSVLVCEQRHHTAAAPAGQSMRGHQHQDAGVVPGAIPTVNGVSSAHWRQHRTSLASGNIVQPV